MSSTKDLIEKICTPYKGVCFIPSEAVDPDLYIPRELLSVEISKLSTEVLEAGYKKLELRQEQNEAHLRESEAEFKKLVEIAENLQRKLMWARNDITKLTDVKELLAHFSSNISDELQKLK